MGMKISSHPVLHLFLYLLHIFTTKMTTAQIIPIKVGVVLDMDDYAEMTLNCISMALSDFYSTRDHYKTRLVLTNRDSKRNITGAAAAAVDLLKNVQVQAIIGPMNSGQAGFLISLGDRANVPVITFSATSPSLTSARTPYFIRATLNDSAQVDAIGAIVEAFGWREAVPIYEDTEFGEGIIPYLTDALEDVNARIPYRSVISPLATDDQIESELYKLRTMQTRVFIVHMLWPLASRLFTKAKQLGMMSQEYAWIITDGIANEFNSMNRYVTESMLGVIGVRPYLPNTKELDDFAIRYKRYNSTGHASDLNIFGLWAYDTAVALAMAAENANLGNPGYKEANISGNFTDIEGVGVSEAGPNLIHALSGTTFKGLAGNFKLVDGQLQAPPYEIVNMVGPGARVIGYWTKKNGIAKDLKITSSSYSASKSDLEMNIWPGGVPSSPKGWVIPTDGSKLSVGVPVNLNEFVQVTWNSDNSTKVEGFSIDVFDAVIAALPYGMPYEYIPFATPGRDMAGTYDELINQVKLGKYDAVVGDVTITANRSKYVDFTLPYTESGFAMVVAVEDERKNSWIFLKPLTWQLWLTSFCSFIFIGCLVWVLEHQINKDFRHPFWYQAGIILWFAFSIIFFAHREKVVSNLTRLVLIIWFLVVFILTQSYTASLSSLLTVQNLSPKINDINMIIRNRENVGYSDRSFISGLLKQMNIEESRLVPFQSDEELDQLFSRGSKNGGIGAVFQELPYITSFLNRYCSKYTKIDRIYKANGFGFDVFPVGSPLVSDISRAILSVTESEQMVEIERKWLGDGNKCPDPNSTLTAANLGVRSFWGLFAIAGGAGLIALGICAMRFLRKKREFIRSPHLSLWRKMKNLAPDFVEEDSSNKDHRCSCDCTATPLLGNSRRNHSPTASDGRPSDAPSASSDSISEARENQEVGLLDAEIRMMGRLNTM